MKVNIKEVIEYYDGPENRSINQRHSSAINNFAGEPLGLALLERYLSSIGESPERIPDKHPTSPKIGNKYSSGWLDAWIKARHNDCNVYYQVEVKNWSMHGFDRGVALPLNPSADELSGYLRTTWDGYWDRQNQSFKDDRLKKVLGRMNEPDPNDKRPVIPIACLWQAMHPEGKLVPMFSIEPSPTGFGEVYVFSMSCYLRQLLEEGLTYLDLTTPDVDERITIMKRLFQ